MGHASFLRSADLHWIRLSPEASGWNVGDHSADSYIQWDRIRYCGWASEILNHQKDGWNLIENGNHLSTAGFRWPIHRIIGRCDETLGALVPGFPTNPNQSAFHNHSMFQMGKKHQKKNHAFWCHKRKTVFIIAEKSLDLIQGVLFKGPNDPALSRHRQIFLKQPMELGGYTSRPSCAQQGMIARENCAWKSIYKDNHTYTLRKQYIDRHVFCTYTGKKRCWQQTPWHTDFHRHWATWLENSWRTGNCDENWMENCAESEMRWIPMDDDIHI